MGKIYLTGDVGKVPTFAEQGPDALDPELTLMPFGSGCAAIRARSRAR